MNPTNSKMKLGLKWDIRIWFSFLILLIFRIAINNGSLNLFFILVMLIAQEGQFIPLPFLRWWHNHSYVCKRALLIYGERSIPTSIVKKVRLRNLYFFVSLDLNLRFAILDFLPPCCSLESSFLFFFRSPYHSMSIVKTPKNKIQRKYQGWAGSGQH